MGRSLPNIPIWQANTSTRFPEITAPRARRPTARHACTGPLSPASCPQDANSPAPAICPDCTLLIRPIFAEATTGSEQMPSATPQAACRGDHRMHRRRRARDQLEPCPCATFHQRGTGVGRGAQSRPSRRGVIVVAAAGNQGTLGSSAITRHPWVIPVVACDLRGRPMSEFESGQFDRQARLNRARRWHHQFESRRTTAHARRNERRGAFCDRGDCAVVVGISRRDGGANQARRFPGFRTAARLGGSAFAGRRGGLSNPVDGECEEVNFMTKASQSKRLSGQERTAASPSAPAWIYHRRGDRAWRRDQASDLLSRNTSPAVAAKAGRPHSTAGWSSLAGEVNPSSSTQIVGRLTMEQEATPETKARSASQDETRGDVAAVTPSQAEAVRTPPAGSETSYPRCRGVHADPLRVCDRPDRGALSAPLGRKGIRAGDRTRRDRRRRPTSRPSTTFCPSPRTGISPASCAGC